MSTKAKPQTAAQLAPRVILCETNPYTFLVEVERLLIAGYRIDFNEPIDLFMNVFTATLALPEA